MTHDEFEIGLEFWCGGKRWRCTDVGSRVIVGICLEPHEVAEVEHLEQAGKCQERRYITDDPSWMGGPPYAVVEYVFDEPSIEACSLVPDFTA
jgi:hypothetical protein